MLFSTRSSGKYMLRSCRDEVTKNWRKLRNALTVYYYLLRSLGIRNIWEVWYGILEKKRDQLGRSCEKCRSITWVKEEWNILYKIKRRKSDWIRHILRGNCFLKHVTEGKLERNLQTTGRRGRRCNQVLETLKEKRTYWELKRKHWLALSVENSLWNSLQACRKTDFIMNE
jgi:hypothetical protein